MGIVGNLFISHILGRSTRALGNSPRRTTAVFPFEKSKKLTEKQAKKKNLCCHGETICSRKAPTRLWKIGRETFLLVILQVQPDVGLKKQTNEISRDIRGFVHNGRFLDDFGQVSWCVLCDHYNLHDFSIRVSFFNTWYVSTWLRLGFNSVRFLDQIILGFSIHVYTAVPDVCCVLIVLSTALWFVWVGLWIWLINFAKEGCKME